MALNDGGQGRSDLQAWQHLFWTRTQWKADHVPQVRDQVFRLFEEYRPPLSSMFKLCGKNKTLGLASEYAAHTSAFIGSRLDDAETKALAQHYIDHIERYNLGEFWVAMGCGVYVTATHSGWPGIPFMWKIQLGEQSKQFSFPGKLMAGARLFGRFLIWKLLADVVTRPISNNLNASKQFKAFEADPRLSRVRAKLRVALAQEAVAARKGGIARRTLPQRAPPNMPPNVHVEQDDEGGSSESVQQQSQSAWSRSRQPTDGWDASGNVDSQYTSPPSQDRFPVEQTENAVDETEGITAQVDNLRKAAESSKQKNSTGNSWERIRQQAQYRESKAAQRPGQKTWEAPQATDGWGSATSDDASPQNRGPQTSYGFSGPDEDVAKAKRQAQKEFDDLLERERRGVEQERRR